MTAQQALPTTAQFSAASRNWRPILPNDLASQAIDVALAVADRLAEPGLTLGAESGAGTAVLYGQLDKYQPDHGWASTAHGCLTSAVTAAEQTGRGYMGLFGGLTGVAFAANSLSRNGTRYGRLLTGLDEALVGAAISSSAVIASARDGLPFHAFDVISGAAGLGAYLLDRQDEAALRAVLTGLVALCGEDDGVPRWYTRYDSMSPDTPMARSYPDGVWNAGLAHGIAGPLALLALAEEAGISVAGQRQAMARAARWLIANRADDEWGPSWASGIPMPAADGSVPAREATHNAWCYGAAGVSRSLWLAGRAIDHDATMQFAVDAMTAVCRRPSDARRVDCSPGLCHGVAGVLQICLRFSQDTGEDVFVDAAAMFTEKLLGLYEPGQRFGYRARGDEGALEDEPGLLDGAAGVALALLAAATDVQPDWDRMLLLA